MHRVYFISLFLFLATCFTPSVAQEITPKNQIELQHDNDFILLTDRYYSSGLYLTYRRRLDRGIFGTDQEQLDFQLQYLAFTPDNVEAFDPASFDRTYAGFLGLESSWTHTQVTSMFRFSLLTGLVGPSSSAGNFQRWYHENIVLFKVPTWAAELENQFHVNASFTYAKE